ncbi:TPA: hypothetical protein ACGSUT_004601 [Vibrio parahaemolyticus]
MSRTISPMDYLRIFLAVVKYDTVFISTDGVTQLAFAIDDF